MKEKTSIIKIKLNSIEINQEDPTLLKGSVIIHDFEESENGDVITQEVCEENKSTLIGKRITCDYIPCEDNNGLDALTDHGNQVGTDRSTGKKILTTKTIAIGFIENVYIGDYTDENGNVKNVLYGDIVIWNDEKYKNIAGLLKDWIDRGIQVHMSVEYLYYNYNVVDGVTYIQSPIIYVAHCLLNSEQRGEYVEISPAYPSAQLLSLNDKRLWNKTLNQIIEKNSKEVNKNMQENMFIKALNNLSFGDIRDKIHTYLKNNMTAAEYEYVWISIYNVHDDYFVYETYEGGSFKNFKVPYTKTDNDEVIVDLNSKQEAEFKGDWVSVVDLQQAKNSLKEANDTIEQLNETIISLNVKVDETNQTKDDIESKFNDVADKLTSMNAKFKEMQPIVDAYNKEQYDKSLNSAIEFYKEKFNGVGAIEDFESEEVQDLITKSINQDSKVSMEAKTSLNSKIVNFIKPETIDEENQPLTSLNQINEKAKNTEDLNTAISEFEETYGFKN